MIGFAYLHVTTYIVVQNNFGTHHYKVKLQSVGVFRRTGRTSTNVATGRGVFCGPPPLIVS